MVRTFNQNNASSLGPGGLFREDYDKVSKGHSKSKGIDYDDILNEKRRQENQYRNSDPHVRGMRSSVSEGYLNNHLTYETSFGQGLNELSGTIQRLQDATKGLNDSTDHFQSYPGSSFGDRDPSHRNSWSAPNGPDGYKPLDMNGSSKKGYTPSSYNGGARHSRRVGGNVAPPKNENFMNELKQQMEEQKARREKEKKGSLEWWEKNPDKQLPVSPTKPHASQRSENFPRAEIGTGDLKSQIEERKRIKEEEKRRQREEDERIDRRIKEQQEKIRSEFEEEQNRKIAKEQAKIKRQEEFMKKQQEMHEEQERAKLEAKERKKKERQALKQGTAGRGKNEEPRQQNSQPFRSNSPPIPAMRGKKPTIQQRNEDSNDDNVVGQLSNMRERLEQKQEEHGDVWNDLVD